MCNIFISGATGKVGRILIEAILEDVDLKLAGGSASKESKDLGKDLGALVGRSNININILEGISNEKDIDLIIDFSRPQNSIQISRFARKENIPMLIGTTGFSEDELTK
jgi:Dihydrodipicolinate reductase